MATAEIIKDAKTRMEKATEDFRHKLTSVRTGRASISLLDGVTVEYYGTPTPLKAMAMEMSAAPRSATTCRMR